MHAKCMLERPTCSKWPKTGRVRIHIFRGEVFLCACRWGMTLQPCYFCIPLLAAGNAFCQAARLHMQMQNKLDSATSFVDAGNAYKKSDPQGEEGPSTPPFSSRNPSHSPILTNVDEYCFQSDFETHPTGRWECLMRYFYRPSSNFRAAVWNAIRLQSQAQGSWL